MDHELDCEMVDVNDIVETIFSIVAKSGYDQGGKKNNNYKNGISTYAQGKAKKCSQCGGTKNLMVHHKDGNRKNNDKSNLQTLCWSCHEKKTDRKG